METIGSSAPVRLDTYVLELRLFGPPRLSWQGHACLPPQPKVLALLCYLALEPEGASREELAELFWASGKMHNVRQALYALRGLPGGESWLHTENLVQIRADTDVARFEHALRAGDYAAALSHWDQEEHDQTLLKGVDLRDLPDFSDWREGERHRLKALYLDALRGQAEALEAVGDHRAALVSAQRLIERDPYDEAAHRLVIRLEHRLGSVERALAAFERCRTSLHEEVGLEPSPETLALLRDIERGSTGQGKRAELLHHAHEVPNQAPYLIGREAELDMAAEKLMAEGRLLLHGFGGVGKTALAATLCARLLAQEYGPTLWLQVGEADPDATFDALARELDAHQQLARATPAEQTRVVQQALEQHHVALVVLDDVWNAYTLARVAGALPAGVRLLVTSRRRYPKLPRLELGRLPHEAATDLLAQHAGQNIEDVESARALCALLGDHAFAVRLAGVTLRERACQVADLLAQLQSAPHDLRLPPGLAEEGRESVVSLLRASLNTVSDAAYEAFLGCGALFVPSCTPELLSRALRRPLAETEDALQHLVESGLAERHARPGKDAVTFTLHDLAYSYAEAHEAIRPTTSVHAVRDYLETHKDNLDELDATVTNLLGAATYAHRTSNGEELVDIMELLAVKGSYFTARGQTPQFLKLMEAAVESAKHLERWEAAHYLYGRLANIYENYIGDYAKAFGIYSEAAKISIDLNDKVKAAISFSCLGVVAYRQGSPGVDYYFEKAYNLAKESVDNLCLCTVLEKYGYVLGSKGSVGVKTH